MESSTWQVLLGSYLAFMVLAIAWLHRDTIMWAAGLGHARLGWI
jgi:hypothetical protein